MNTNSYPATIKAVFLNSLPVLILNKQANKSACPEFNYLNNLFYSKTQNSSNWHLLMLILIRTALHLYAFEYA